jgi:hypothetical protein
MPHMNPEWTRWAKNTIRLIRDGGFMVYPLDGKGVAYKVDKTNHKLITLAEHPEYNDSDTARTNVAVFEAIGYEVVRDEPVSYDLAEVCRRIHAESETSLITGDVIIGLSKLFKVEKTVVEDMIHKATTGNKEPINPITIRGTNGVGDQPRALAIGRIWLSSTDVGEGQHKFDPQKPGHEMDKTMQFISFDEPNVHVHCFMVGDENDFIKGIRELRQEGQRAFKMTGTPKRGDAEQRDLIFSKAKRGDDWVLIVNFYNKTVDGPVASTVMLDYAKFNKGLDHLFTRGELVFPENN